MKETLEHEKRGGRTKTKKVVSMEDQKGEQERKGGGVGTTLRNRQDQVELVGGQKKIEVKKGEDN